MGILARMVIAPIRLYQRFVSPVLPANCRYYPTCSAYAVEAVEMHGAFRGAGLALRRLGRCHPWSRREHFDPVPVPVGWSEIRVRPENRPDREPPPEAGSSITGQLGPVLAPGSAVAPGSTDIGGRADLNAVTDSPHSVPIEKDLFA